MKVTNFTDKDEWLLARRCKITGSRLKNIVVKRGTGKKIGFYELVAERLGLPADEENPMDRGTRLEDEAIQRFTKETKKEVDPSLIMWSREDNPNIAISPDGVISDTEAVEVKCLGSARHIEAFLTQKIPSDYEEQVLQYFIVNDKLEKLYFVFYDPRLEAKDFFYIEVNRKDKEDEIKFLLDYQREVLEEVNQIVINLTF